MYAYDPLQHHGWFVLPEFDLRNYCEAYFPSVLFRYAKALLPGSGERVVIAPRDSQEEIHRAFQALSNATARQLEKRRPKNLYELKNLLSRFMLLPALYLQALRDRGVWKGDSFDLAKSDIHAEVWESMERVSSIRSGWSYEASVLRRWLLMRTQFWGHFLRTKVSVPIPVGMMDSLDEKFYSDMADLVRVMQQKFEGIPAKV